MKDKTHIEFLLFVTPFFKKNIKEKKEKNIGRRKIGKN